MIRQCFAMMAVLAMAACSNDGRGSQYSSARAQSDNPVFIPVTPGATPVQVSGATPVQASGATALPPPNTPVTQTAVANGTTQQVVPAVLTEPVAITPGAQPVTPLQAGVTQASVVTQPLVPPADVTAQAPAVSLKPQPAPRTQTAQIIPAAVSAPRTTRTTQRKYARGTLYKACRSAGRREATDRRCGCVQWVADQSLTPAQQKRGAGYFTNQQGVQDARQSDSAADEAFWTAWKAFGKTAGQQCRAS